MVPAMQAVVGVGAMQRANRLTVILLGLQRLSYLPPTVLALGGVTDRSHRLTVVLVSVTLAWNVVLFAVVRREGWVPSWAPWVDVGWVVVLYLAATWNSATVEGGGAPGWVRRMGQAAAALAGAAINSVPLAALAVALLAVAYTVALLLSPAGLSAQLADLGGYVNGMVWFALIFGFVVRYLRRQGVALDQATERRLEAEAQVASGRARLRAFEALHDTVLNTLVAIARGGLDHRTDAVRRRCARDAELVRRILADEETNGAEPAGLHRPGLHERLAELADSAGELGLRVHLHREPLPASARLPADVVDAMCAAVGEAINNVHRHAGVSTCWVTLLRQDGEVLVRVVDRGSGFEPDKASSGFGLRWTIDARMRETGGRAAVHSTVGAGTTVELRWRP